MDLRGEKDIAFARVTTIPRESRAHRRSSGRGLHDTQAQRAVLPLTARERDLILRARRESDR